MSATPAVESQSIVNHSPEPWALHSGGTSYALFEVRSGAEIVALVICEEDVPIRVRDLADAALIVAAPRMLRALRECAKYFRVPLAANEIASVSSGDLKLIAPACDVDALLADLKKQGVF